MPSLAAPSLLVVPTGESRRVSLSRMTCGLTVIGFDPEDPLGVALEDHRAFGVICDGLADVGDGGGDQVVAAFGVERRVASEHDVVRSEELDDTSDGVLCAE